MLTSQDVTHYSKCTRYIHWVMAFVVLVLLGMGFFLEDLNDTVKATAIMLHKSFGLIVLGLMACRLYCIHRSTRPALPKSTPCWERLLSRTVQYALYVLMIAMPISGWVMSTLSGYSPSFFGLILIPFPGLSPNEQWADWFFQAHQTIAWLLIGLIALHIAGALKHALLDKDQVLESMLQ